MVKPTNVTNAIRSLRFAHGEMTQAQLAEHAGVTRQTIIAIEQGKYSPSLEMAFRIARAFNVPLDDVFQYPFPSSNQGVTCRMKNMVPWCTGEPGAETAKAYFLDEHGANPANP